jgi:hypothetical protein
LTVKSDLPLKLRRPRDFHATPGYPMLGARIRTWNGGNQNLRNFSNRINASSRLDEALRSKHFPQTGIS